MPDTSRFPTVTYAETLDVVEILRAKARRMHERRPPADAEARYAHASRIDGIQRIAEWLEKEARDAHRA